MLSNAYFLAKIGADTAENEQHFAENLPIGRRVADQADSAPRWWEKARAERYISAEYTLRQEFARKQVPRRAALPANSGNILADCEKFTIFRQNFATFRRI